MIFLETSYPASRMPSCRIIDPIRWIGFNPANRRAQAKVTLQIPSSICSFLFFFRSGIITPRLSEIGAQPVVYWSSIVVIVPILHKRGI